MAESSDRIEKLVGSENWEIWKFSMRCLLGEKPFALEVVLGELTLPVIAGINGAVGVAGLDAEQQTVAANYLKGNRAAMGVLIRSIEPKILVT
jgi:hypothetical protein